MTISFVAFRNSELVELVETVSTVSNRTKQNLKMP